MEKDRAKYQFKLEEEEEIEEVEEEVQEEEILNRCMGEFELMNSPWGFKQR